jgi:hypothetical protein
MEPSTTRHRGRLVTLRTIWFTFVSLRNPLPGSVVHLGEALYHPNFPTTARPGWPHLCGLAREECHARPAR